MPRWTWIVVWSLGCGPGDKTEDEGSPALDQLVSQVLEPSGIEAEEVVVHEVGHLLAGAVVAPAFAADGGEVVAQEVTEPTTLFLVDRNAGAQWAHDVDWVWIDDDGDARVEEASFYPVVDGVPFVPEWNPSVWGAPWEPYDPDEPADDEDLPVWDEGSGGYRAAGADPCDPPKPKVSVTIRGTWMRAARTDAQNWVRLFRARGFQQFGVGSSRTAGLTKEQALAPIRAAVAVGPLEELVIVYAGHGLKEQGMWALGDTVETITGYVTPADLVRELAGADVERLTIVALSCYSGQLASLPQALKDAGMESTDIVLQASSGPNEVAWIPNDPRRGSAFAMALHETASSTLPGEPIPWEGIRIPALTTVTSKGPQTQTPTFAERERCQPEIELATHPELGTCYAAWLDQLDPQQFVPTQDYGREVMITGAGFGSATGRVELQQEDGDWVTVPHRFWGAEGIAFNLPMRRDGFPANGLSPGVPGDLVDPADQSGQPGTYLVHVVTAEDFVSPPQPIKVEFQQYEQIWTPMIVEGDFPDWVEQWHPLTPEALWTLGPTVQLSRTWDAAIEESPLLTASGLDSDQDQAHLTSPWLGSPGWHYEIPASIRNIGTAYDTSYPEFQYYGYRIRFDSDSLPASPWGFTLIYD